MKKILLLFCFILAAYAVYFPLSYFGSIENKMEIKTSHILVNTEEEALKIKQEIENGLNFETAASKYSQCPSKENGGDLGYAQRGRYEKEFENAVFSIPQGKLSDPVKTRYGWHLIKTNDTKYYSGRNNFVYKPYKYLDL